MELWGEAKKETNKKKRGRTKKQRASVASQDQINARRANKLVSEGQYSRASQALMSDGIAEVTAKTVCEMKLKHPHGEVPELLPDPDAQPLVLSRDQIRTSVSRFKKGSAPGPSELRGNT